ncbi:Methyltransferase type 12 [Venturia nashicola]|nr:Methyltransferase type 12 [Venturia nashicola]
MSSEKPSHLDPSDLGTKKYWDEAYEREIDNHAQAPDDEGTIWFSDSGAEEKMIDFLEEYADEAQLSKDNSEEHGMQATTFLDLGTGNGHLLFALRDVGWEGHMVGVDYSAASIRLARQIGQRRLSASSQIRKDGASNSISDDNNEDEEAGGCNLPVQFEEYDTLNPTPLPHSPQDGFDVLLDKGTFDAISLSSEIDASGRRICELYSHCILPLLKPNGIFLITSCNWTEEELRSWFEKERTGDYKFKFHDRIKYPSFTFGGHKGQSVVTLCFKKTKTTS